MGGKKRESKRLKRKEAEHLIIRVGPNGREANSTKRKKSGVDEKRRGRKVFHGVGKRNPRRHGGIVRKGKTKFTTMSFINGKGKENIFTGGGKKRPYRGKRGKTEAAESP